MPKRSEQRDLTEELRAWSPTAIATLLVRRADLVRPQPPAGISELAQRAQHHRSMADAIAATSLPENRLLQVIVCLPRGVELTELATALPEGVTPADAEPVLRSLEAAALVWRHAGRIHCPDPLRQVMPTTLGPPVRHLLEDQTVDYLNHTIRVLRSSLDGGVPDQPLPSRTTGPAGRPPRKTELIDEIEALLVVPGRVADILRGAPQPAVELARALATGRPSVTAREAVYLSHHTSSYYRRSPTYWLYERALVLPDADGSSVVQPLEVGVALRGGRPVADLALDEPTLAVAEVDLASLDRHAAGRAILTLGRLADLLDQWRAEPARELKSGGLGVTVMRQVAAALEVDVDEAGCLVELANLAGLVGSTTVVRRERRIQVSEVFVGPTDTADQWLAVTPVQQWHRLVRAWMRAEHWPSASGRKDADGSALPVMTRQWAHAAPDRRHDVLQALATLAPGEATTVDALAAAVYWRAPHPWLETRIGPGAAIGWVHAEAELLGVVAEGSLSTFGRALVHDDVTAAEAGFDAALPEPATTFTLQADHTAMVVGTLHREVLGELRLLADVESTGAATTFRFSEASLRRALDAGRDDASILSFLGDHAAKGVPKPLAYLVKDVARRHGHLQVGSAGSFVTSDDPAVLADACSHRRTRKLALRLLAPTVAVSPHPSSKVLDGLRDAGFLPTLDPAAPGGPLTVTAPVVASSATPRADPRGDTGLPERFAAAGRRQAGGASALDLDAARELASAIVTASVDIGPDRVATLGAPSSDPAAFTSPFGARGSHDPEELDVILERAVEDSRVVAVALDDDSAEPMLLAVTGWEYGMLEGIDLADHTPTEIARDEIGAALDLGPFEDFLNVRALRPRSGRRRR